MAVSLLEDGRTAHSVYKIPIPIYADSVCNISMESKIANELRKASLILWDEIVMCAWYCNEAVDRTLSVIMKSSSVPFGGKCILFSGDFQQILPVVPSGSRGMIVFTCFKSSPLYEYVNSLSLTENMRLRGIQNDKKADKEVLENPEFFLQVGEGKIEGAPDSLIPLPPAVNIVDSVTDLVQSVFQNIEKKYDHVGWLTSRAISTPINSRLQYINNQVAERFPEKFSAYKSADSVLCDSLEAQNAAELRHLQELLNSFEVGSSLPDHEITLKKGFIVMLLQNTKPSSGHVNGARYVVEGMTPNLLFFTSASGSRPGIRLMLPRMNYAVSNDDFPIPGFRRCQSPIRVCFAMTINKAQCQSISGTLGIDLHGHCFSHRKLYVALSRTTNPWNVLICTTDGSNRTKNIVFSEVFYPYGNEKGNKSSLISINPTISKEKGDLVSTPNLLNQEFCL